MKKSILYHLIVSLSLLPATFYAQVGVGTTAPRAQFHIDGARNTPATGTPSSAQEANDFVVTNLGRVGIGTITPQANLESIGKVRLTDVKDNLLAGGNYGDLAIDATTGDLGYVTPGAAPILYRKTKETRPDTFNNSNWIVAPINTNAITDINTLDATFGNDGSIEYVQFSQAGIYRIELFGYVNLDTGYSENAFFHMRLRKSNSSGIAWSVLDNQRLLNRYPFANSAAPLREFIYVGSFATNDRISFDLGTQGNTINTNGGWTKPITNEYSLQLLITKL